MAIHNSSRVAQDRRSRTFLKQQGEEALHRGVVPGRTDLAHRANQTVPVQDVAEFP
jgi:hypothetical protein